MKKIVPFGLLIIVVILAFMFPGNSTAAKPGVIDKADTAWLLISTALVLLMTPAWPSFMAGWFKRKT